MTVEEMYAQGYSVTMHASARALEEHKERLIKGGSLSNVIFEFAETGLMFAGITVHVLGAKRITKTLKKQLEEANGNENGIKAEASE
jgi:hypothetical protein